MVSKKIMFVIAFLILVSPVFGVILADMVGYHEPLDVAAEILGLNDITEDINWTPFLDYTVPGLPDVLGYIVSGFIGVGVILALGYVLKRFTSKEKV